MEGDDRCIYYYHLVEETELVLLVMVMSEVVVGRGAGTCYNGKGRKREMIYHRRLDVATRGHEETIVVEERDEIGDR